MFIVVNAKFELRFDNFENAFAVQQAMEKFVGLSTALLYYDAVTKQYFEVKATKP